MFVIDGSVIFLGKTYLAADWHPQAKQQFYLEDEAKVFSFFLCFVGPPQLSVFYFLFKWLVAFLIFKTSTTTCTVYNI